SSRLGARLQEQSPASNIVQPSYPFDRILRQSPYAVAELASAVLECPNSSLTAFDSCMMSFEATDWTVVFSTIAANSGTENDMRIGIERFVDRALPQLNVSDATVADLRSRLLQIEILKANGRVRFSSAATFSTSEREGLQAAFRDTSYRAIEPLFYRHVLTE
ncbi:MAG: hypothetical protein ABJO27_00040, partial [Pseudoruegeria sp.]